MPSHYTPSATELTSGLYLVATPIGNLADISLRALNVLSSVDIIACEDTRVSQRLLNHYGIQHARLEAYHEHNALKMRPKLLQLLQGNSKIALISDAGTPLISDPGYKLVQEAIEANIPVVPIPGASSVLAALCLAGLPTDKFAFIGFLPNQQGDVVQLLKHFTDLPASLVAFSTAGKLKSHLTHCLAVLGDRQVAICRELTKLYEEAWRGSISEILQAIDAGREPRGEIVVVIAPAAEKPALDAATIDAALLEHLSRLPLKTAAQEVADLFDIPKNKLYQRALELKNQL